MEALKFHRRHLSKIAVVRERDSHVDIVNDVVQSVDAHALIGYTSLRYENNYYIYIYQIHLNDYFSCRK